MISVSGVSVGINDLILGVFVFRLESGCTLSWCVLSHCRDYSGICLYNLSKHRLSFQNLRNRKTGVHSIHTLHTSVLVQNRRLALPK